MIRTTFGQLLGSGWELRPYDKPVAFDGNVYSMTWMACYQGGNLVVYVNVDRGANSILVGTNQAGDLYPFEDLAICCGWADRGRLHEMFDTDPGKEFVPLAEALNFLSCHAGDLDSRFAPGRDELRNELRETAARFHADWDEAVEKRRRLM